MVLFKRNYDFWRSSGIDRPLWLSMDTATCCVFPFAVIFRCLAVVGNVKFCSTLAIMILTLNFIFYTLRLLKYFFGIPNLGPKALILWHMVKQAKLRGKAMILDKRTGRFHGVFCSIFLRVQYQHIPSRKR